ncbi:MAG: F0F1 ATP synthase subunit gamma [Methylomonas sp.]|jgi:F-type H+-transporting ATPase subunit gamma|uniref:F0F1 ATP synthase subunit gamma n=1 Tax=Methylomonas sp. TaxID=418 RepID=UPI0025D82166|nr:F0F1 ATP synthase subunit gamma [Methylomonas sp.]MCK9607081.1 F0F1 ATP synthase subunit gamma [Methylomonas sp.]
METEQTLRRRIKTVGDLHAIVRTMKALAAVSARQYEAVLKSLDDYTQTVEMGLQVALRGKVFDKPDRPRAIARLAAIIFGSDVGLCGRFNEDLVNFSLDSMSGLGVSPSARTVLAVGGRIQTRLSELDHPVQDSCFTPGSATAITATVRLLLSKIDAWQDRGFERVLLFYNQSGSPTQLHLLPVDPRSFGNLSQAPWPSHLLPSYSLDTESLLAALIRQHLFICLFRACSASLASEHQMRLRTTQAAEKNIQEKLDELAAEFRMRRQDAIDAELLDIGAGFEAVNSD